MSDLPEPLTPPDCDLRGYEFMPLDTIRLLDSDLFALSTGDEFKAALALWCKSWSQIPAASLPADERVLAHLSGAGARWRKVRDLALRNWIKCADGRLYHPVVAEKALEAWGKRSDWRETENNKTERQRRWRERQKLLSDQLRALDITPPKGASLETLERLLRDAGVDVVVDGQASTRPSTVDAGEMPKTGTGTGTGTIPPSPPSTPRPPPRSPPPNDQHQAMCIRIADEAGMIGIPPDHQLLREWLALPDMQLERDILPVVRRVAARVKDGGGKTPFKFRLFDTAIREQHAQDEADIARLRAGRERIERLEREQRGEVH